MDQKIRFISDYLNDYFSFAELCSRFGISRKTGYKWVSRYLVSGSLNDLSRKPHNSPAQTPVEVVESILKVRDRHPFMMYCTSCKKSTEPINNDKPPPGFQEDIPWPSLADSPWPMNHGDPQSTGRSKYPGPMAGIIDWSIDSLYVESGVSIGSDQTVYFNSAGPLSGLIAANPDGSIKWRLEVVITNNSVSTTPLVAADGTIYIGGGAFERLFAVNSNGTIKWEFEPEGSVYTVGMNIGLDGTIYFVSGSVRGVPILYAVNPDGSLRWSFAHDNPRFSINKMADGMMDKNGNYYFALDTLYSLDYDGNLRWKLGLENTSEEPLTCDINGVVYLPLWVGSSMAAVSSEGGMIWQLDFPLGVTMGQSPALSIDQIMYVALYKNQYVYVIR